MTINKIIQLMLLGLVLSQPVIAGKVAPDQWSIQPLLTGSMAPAFEATGADGKNYRFQPDRLERPALIIFYRGGWCPYCNLHWAELRHIEDQLLELDLDIIFLSADQPSVLAEALDDGEQLPYYLLSDNTTVIAQAFGIAFKLDDETVGRYANHPKIDIEAASGYTHHVLPAPAVFLTDRDGVIKFQYVNPDYKVRLHPDVLLAVARTMPERRLKK